jgi:hypothetical protein
MTERRGLEGAAPREEVPLFQAFQIGMAANNGNPQISGVSNLGCADGDLVAGM